MAMTAGGGIIHRTKRRLTLPESRSAVEKARNVRNMVRPLILGSQGDRSDSLASFVLSADQ
jgi:hypothetical protein